MSLSPFSPSPGKTVNISVSGSSQAVFVCDPGVRQIRIMNNGTATVWLDSGASTITTSATTGFPVGPGAAEVITVKRGTGAIYMAAIAAGATGSVYFTPGDGI